MHGGMKLRPWEIQRLTLPEMAAAMDEDTEKRRPPTGASKLDPVAYAAWWRGLSMRDKLEQARERA